jgi:glutamyl-tRNA synthetase
MLIRDRCHLIPEFYTQGWFFFSAPKQWDLGSLKPKWNAAKTAFFNSFSNAIAGINDWNAFNLETVFKDLANTQGIKPGELQLPLRIMLVGEKMGPPVFEIASLLGKEETIKRIHSVLDQTGNW